MDDLILKEDVNPIKPKDNGLEWTHIQQVGAKVYVNGRATEEFTVGGITFEIKTTTGVPVWLIRQKTPEFSGGRSWD